MNIRSVLLAAVALSCGGLSAQPMLLVPTSPQRSTAMPAGGGGIAQKRTQPTEAELAARAFRQPQIRGRKLLRAVGKVTKELNWHDDLEDAVADAQQLNRPILWIQALGKLTGYT